MKKLIDHIYKKSVLRYFTKNEEIEHPHFKISYQNDNSYESQYESMDHFTVEAKMQTRYLRTLEKNYDINTDEEFINVLIHEGNKQLNDYFINYIDEKSEILEFPFYKFSKLEKIYHQFFNKNYRFSIKDKKINIKQREYFQGILENIINKEEKPSLSYENNYYIIISNDLVDLLSTSTHIISDPINNSFFQYGRLYHGSMGSKTISVFINKKQDDKTLYIGSYINKESSKLKLYYYTHDNVLTEHHTPDNFLVVRLNLYYKLFDTGNHKFKKVIFT